MRHSLNDAIQKRDKQLKEVGLLMKVLTDVHNPDSGVMDPILYYIIEEGGTFHDDLFQSGLSTHQTTMLRKWIIVIVKDNIIIIVFISSKLLVNQATIWSKVI